MAESTPSRGTALPKYALAQASVVVGVGVLATSLAQPQVLAGIPFENLLKNELHLDRAASAAFFFWASFPWYFKPLAGIITDTFPLFRSRRKSYLLIAALLTVFAWLGLYFTPHTYHRLLWLTVVINVFMVFASTVVGAYMVEIAQRVSGSGRLSAVNNLVEQICLLLAGPGAGFLASVAFGWTAAACGMVMFTILPVAFFLLREEEIAIDSNAQLRTTGQQLARMSREKAMWLAVGLMTLFYLAPGLQTAVFYKQQDELHLNTRWQGIFELIGGACGMAAAFGYAFLCKRVNLRKLLLVSLAFGTLANLPYMAYTSVPRAVVIEGFNGFAYGLAELAIMDLAVRATPKGIEGFGFSLMMSVRNFALFGSDWLGSNLIDHFHWRFRSVVLTNSLVCALTIPAVLLLPSMMLKRKDAEPEVQTQIKPAVRDQEQCEVEEVGV